MLFDRRSMRPYALRAKLIDDILLEFLRWRSHRVTSAESNVDAKQRIIIGISNGDQI
jgi:hypothetical protein